MPKPRFSGVNIDPTSISGMMRQVAGGIDANSTINEAVRRFAESGAHSLPSSEALRQIVGDIDAHSTIRETIRRFAESNGHSLSYGAALRDAAQDVRLPSAFEEMSRRLIEGWGSVSAASRTLRQAAGTMEAHSAVIELTKQLAADNSLSSLAAEVLRMGTTQNTFVSSPHFEALRSAAHNLPPWLKPASPAEMLLPSWQVTAGFGAAYAAPQSLIHDVLSVLHRGRPETIAFETAVRIAEVADVDEKALDEHVRDILRDFTQALIDFYLGTHDFVKRNGIMNIIMFIVAIGEYYEAKQSRLYAAEQVELARAAPSSEPDQPPFGDPGKMLVQHRCERRG